METPKPAEPATIPVTGENTGPLVPGGTKDGANLVKGGTPAKYLTPEFTSELLEHMHRAKQKALAESEAQR
ncbi:hypothetical protein AYO44_02830 [Planctomycetaceae bacterium SCGC AG-212-F19]|nr:hypothetical protein AYO44_02830 [Planctomycetaceae bacterium SCGC AG-212-F19]